MTIQDLSFDDCIVVGFSRDAARQTLTLTFEGFEANGRSTTPDLYILECAGVSDLRLRYAPEFPEDLNRPYSPRGDDQRANEIHSLRRDAKGYLHLHADMVEGSFHCAEFRLLRVIEEVEAN
jgi:hypothetical protein